MFALFSAKPLNRGDNPRSHSIDGPVSVNICKTSQFAVVLDHRRRLGLVNAHTLPEGLLGIVSTLDQRSTFNVANSFNLRGFAVDVVDGLADWAVPAPRNATQ